MYFNDIGGGELFGAYGGEIGIILTDLDFGL